MANDYPSVKVTIRLSRAEAIRFLERLAEEEDFKKEYEGNPREVLAANGIEIDPPEAVPPQVRAPSPDDLRRGIRELTEPGPMAAPFIGWWPFAPFLGLLSIPETGGPEQEA